MEVRSLEWSRYEHNASCCEEKIAEIKLVVEYNKRGKGCGPAHTEMQSYIGQGGKTSVLSSAAKKWKDFKSTLTRHYILPYIKEREKLSQPPEIYKFIEKAEWDAFVASRLSKEFESVHSQHSQIREKLENNHQLSRKGYAGLDDQLEETMPGDELQKQVAEGSLSVSGSNDVLTLALGPEHPGRVRGVGVGISPRQFFNLPRQQRVKLADQLKESVRIVLQEETKKMEARSREETLRMEARTKQLVEAEREHLLSQLSQLIPNFDPSMLKPKTSPCQNQGVEKSPKNPMSDKASCSGADVRSLHLEDDTAKNGEQQEETKSGALENQDEEKKEEKKDEEKKGEKKEKKDEDKKEDKNDEEKKEEKQDEEKHDEEPQGKIMTFTIEKEVFGADRSTFVLYEDITQFAGMEEIGATLVAIYMRCLYDRLREANMWSMVGFIDPAQVSANTGSLTDISRIVASRLQKTDGEQIFMMPYNPGHHWVLLIVRAKRETVYFLDPLPRNRVVDDEGKNIVNSALKIYNSHIGRPGRKAPIWKTLPGTPKQPSSVECGYYVMRFMRDIIMDPSLEFEKNFAKGKEQAPYPQEAIDEVRNEWADLVCLQME
ncbi:unnamed protein product [Prunus armeniaca]